MTQNWDPKAYARDGAFVHQLAGGVVEWLAPRPGERILDLGCGDGQLTARIAAGGIEIRGVDSSAAMVAAARERGVDAEIRRAILSHADFSGVPRESPLEKTLFACDELAGFLTACSYVKPGRSIHEVDVKSVRKKLKDKAFARSVNRDDITNGAAELNVDLDGHIEFCIEAMKQRAAELGLAGAAQSA